MKNTQDSRKRNYPLEKEQQIKGVAEMGVAEGARRKGERRRKDRRKTSTPVETERRMSNEDRRILERRKKQNEESRKRLRAQQIS